MVPSFRLKLSNSFMLVFVFVSCVFGQDRVNSVKILNPNSIIQISYANSAGIEASRNKLKSAEYNFKLFESEYTQFIPLLLDTRIKRKAGNQTSGEIVAGMEKEFFDGSALSFYLGNSMEKFGGGYENTHFVEGSLEFPLFSSNRKLSRLIKRTFEENELYSANLGYVNTIRRVIRSALERYYDLVPRKQILELLQKYRQVLTLLLQEERVRTHPMERQQIEDEIRSLDSDIKGWEMIVGSLKIKLQRWLGVESLDEYYIQPIPLGLDDGDYFGKEYVENSYESVLERAFANDTEIKIMRLIIKNAKEKKRLAEQGKWDFFVSLNGRYSYIGSNEQDSYQRDYFAGAGLKINRMDAEVLRYSRAKAESDIISMQAMIKDRKLEMATRIRELKGELEKQREQLKSIYKSLQSRHNVYDNKRSRYLQGDETVDNLIQAFRSLVNTEKHLYQIANDYFDNIRDLQYLCGVYFEKLGIDIK